VVTPATGLDVEESEGSLVEFRPQTRLSDLVEALNSLGVKPRDLMAILQALKAANALQAELVFM
jgi:flagellar P-ring protein precursor FlgI